MYKCTECGMEYEVKPDYCDCGNDEFVLTVTANDEPVIESEIKPVHVITEQQQTVQNNKSDLKTNIPCRISFSPYAIAFFVVCLILSFLILFAWNPKLSETGIKESESIKTDKVSQNIPNIEKLWKEPEPIKVDAVKQEEISAQKPITVAPKLSIVKQKTTVKQTNKKTVSVPLPQKATQVVRQNKPVQTTSPKPVVKSQANIDEDAKKAAEAAKKMAEAKQKAEEEAKQAAEKARQLSLSKQELLNYKIALRNTIGKKIDFTKVIGDGNCTVTFKLDSTGSLINRTFAKQSSNLTLNNAVYKAVMATPNFTQPPAAYKNETLRLNISFNNGNFAITLE